MEPEGPVEQYNTKNPLILISGLLYFIYYFCISASISFTLVLLFASLTKQLIYVFLALLLLFDLRRRKK